MPLLPTREIITLSKSSIPHLYVHVNRKDIHCTNKFCVLTTSLHRNSDKLLCYAQFLIDDIQIRKSPQVLY